MVYKITEQTFLNIVKRQSCLGRQVQNGESGEGHEKCNGCCSGNYFVGGQCNFGGRHTIQRDLEIINQNFSKFNLLLQRQDEIYKAVSEKDFNQIKQSLINDFEYLIRKCEDKQLDYFSGTCILTDGKQDAFLEEIKKTLRVLATTIDRFVKKTKDLDWWRLKNYRDKIEQLEQMGKEAAQLMVEYKKALERGDTKEAQRLMGLYQQKKTAMGSLQREIEQDSLNEIMGKEAKEFFTNIIQNIFGGKTKFFDPSNKEKEHQEEKKYFGFLPQKWGKRLMWGGGLLVLIVVIYWLIKKFLKK